MSEERKDQGGLEGMGEKVGGFAGRMAGRAGDAAVDATGAIFGSMASMLGSWWSGDEARQTARMFTDRDDRECRRHFDTVRPQQRSHAASDYATTRPYYQLGYVARHSPEYRNRRFSDVEPELRRAWSSSPQGRERSWDEVRDYVGYAFERRPTGSSGEVLGL